MRVRDEVKERAIRQEAMELIVREGFDGLSMHKLARAAGVSAATIYIYFEDREDLILSLCREETERMTAATLKDFDPALSLAEGLRNQWHNRANYWLKHPLEAQFMERMRHSPYHDKMMDFVRTHFGEVMYRFVDGAIRNRELVQVPIEVFWSVAYAPLYQLVKFHMDGTSLGGKKFVFSRRLMDQTLGLVLKALKP